MRHFFLFRLPPLFYFSTSLPLLFIHSFFCFGDLETGCSMLPSISNVGILFFKRISFVFVLVIHELFSLEDGKLDGKKQKEN